MAKGQRLIDAWRLVIDFAKLKKHGEFDHENVLAVIASQETVDAVEAEKYNRLVEAYHELRENFVDFVCSGIPKVSPYCLNRCDGCCDAYGWCRQSDLCKGFNPAEVILGGERKDNE